TCGITELLRCPSTKIGIPYRPSSKNSTLFLNERIPNDLNAPRRFCLRRAVSDMRDIRYIPVAESIDLSRDGIKLSIIKINDPAIPIIPGNIVYSILDVSLNTNQPHVMTAAANKPSAITTRNVGTFASLVILSNAL